LNDLKAFSNLLISIGFSWYVNPKNRFGCSNSILIDTTDNTLLTVYVNEDDYKICNEIPDYIKEYLENGS